MKLFDGNPRNYDRPARFGESEFNYLNRSSLDTISRIRDLLETWFSHYPTAEQLGFRGRFCSSENSNHRSAFFELLLHELLLRLGCQVVVEPILRNTSKKVDFRVESPKGHDFYLEAVHVSGESRDQAESRARENVVYDALNNLDSPNFYINLEVSGTPESPFPAAKFRKQLERKLAQLNPDSMIRVVRLGFFNRIPIWDFEYDGWKVVYYPTPKEPDVRGNPGIRPLATIQRGGIIDSEGPIINAIVGKAKRYGELDLPFVVAVNAIDEFVTQRDVLRSLYGSISGLDDLEILNDSRGVWGSETNPQWTRLSAVLVTMKLWPWKITNAPIVLYHNPRPRQHYTGELDRFSQILPYHNRLKAQEGESLASIFNLPEEWPEI